MSLNDDYYDVRAALMRLRKEKAAALAAFERLMRRMDELETENEQLRKLPWTRQGGGQTVYEWREIGETEWRVCDEEWFKFCQNSPLYDTRAKQGGAGC